MMDERSTPGRTDADNEPADEETAGGVVSFPYDRMTVDQFRHRFPRARWRDDIKAWWVPGKTASKRIGRWLAEQEAEADAHADARGRDAFDFDPIVSPYLEIGRAGFQIRTPYSKTVVEELREIRFSRWDADLRLWHIPFRSFEDLQSHWPAIETAARRSEPAERAKRAELRKGTEDDLRSKARSTERRKRRFPLPIDDLPPTGVPVAISFGIVVFDQITGELVDPGAVTDLYPGVTENHIWGLWRPPALNELLAARPAKAVPEPAGEWWMPTIDELRPARRAARSREGTDEGRRR